MKIEDEVKNVQEGVNDPNKKAFIGNAVARMKMDANSAMAMMPMAASKLSGKARTDFLEEYKTAVSTLLDKIDKLQDAVKAGDPNGIKVALDEVSKIRGSIHSRYLSGGDSVKVASK